MKNIFTLFVASFLFTMIFVSCQKQTVTNTVYVKDTTIVNTTIKRDSIITTDSSTVRDTTIVTDTASHGGGIVGFWPGTFNNPGYVPLSQFSFLFNSNGTVRVYADGTDTSNAPFIGDGIYQIIGYSVATRFTISGNLYSGLGTVDSNFIFYEGTVGQGLNTSGIFVDIAHK